MRSVTPVLAVLGGLFLAGCDSLLFPDTTTSRFATPTAGGAFNIGLSQSFTDGLIDADGEGFLFQNGLNDDDQFVAVAGLLPGTDVEFRPSTGIGTYSGDYYVGSIVDIDTSGGVISGFGQERIGAMSLNVDFANGDVSGQSGDGLLTIDGGLTGRDLEGTVVFDGVNGALDRLVGGDQAFGVFHGNNSSVVYAGGFIADRD